MFVIIKTLQYHLGMDQNMLAEAGAVRNILLDLKGDLEVNTVDVGVYANRVSAELSPLIVNIVVNSTSSAEIINQYSILFVLILDPNTVAFYLQPVVQQWLDLILDALKSDP
jgi:hypothetical protein